MADRERQRAPAGVFALGWPRRWWLAAAAALAGLAVVVALVVAAAGDRQAADSSPAPGLADGQGPPEAMAVKGHPGWTVYVGLDHARAVGPGS